MILRTGFRPGFATTHQLFITQHLLDMAAGSHSLLFAFLDLTKAYDRVSRPQLWTAMQRLGIPSKVVGATQAILDSTQYSVKVEGRHGQLFHSTTGVPQGNPLSPTLLASHLTAFRDTSRFDAPVLEYCCLMALAFKS